MPAILKKMLINDIDTLKKYVPSVVGDNFEKYIFYLKTADDWLINEFIGKKLYDVAGSEQAEESLNEYCKSIVANKAYLDAIPVLDLVETESGFAVTSNSNLTPASRERVNALMTGIEKRLGDCIELLLEFLESSTAHLGDWKDAKAYSINHDSYIFTLKEFRRYGRFDGSRLEWIKEMPKVTRALRYKIEPVISKELSATIISQLQNNSLDEANKNIIEDLRMSLAAFVTGDEAAGNSFLYRARMVILGSIDSYPDFKSSSVYEAQKAQTDSYSVDHSIMNCGV